jgi:large subunit ribosomal protein L25
MELTIECKTRPADSKPNALRQSGLIPAVLYGHSGLESVPLMVDAKAVEMLLRDASINNSLIQVNIPELPWNGKALLREVQSHPWKRFVYHVSFFAVGTHASLEVNVPLHLVGDPIGVKQGGGSLEQLLTTLPIKCRPDNIPETINVDVSQLNVGASIHINEIPLPGDITVLTDTEQVVATVLSPSGGASEAAA